MRIENIRLLAKTLDKLNSKHHVQRFEVVEVLDNEERRPKIRFVESGDREGEDVYLALGQTEAGRRLAVFFIHKLNNDALIITARNMTQREREQYARK